MNTQLKKYVIGTGCFILVIFLNMNILAKEKVLISANETVVAGYKKFTADIPCEKINNFNSPHTAFRAVLELVFISKALYLAGFDAELVIEEMPNYERALIMATEGKVAIPAETLWEIDIDETVFYKSEPIIRQGEFEQGIFTLPGRKDVLGVTSLEELKQFSAVSQKNWRVDWETLQEMGLKEVQSTTKISSMFKMVQQSRVDFLLWTFSSSEDMSQTLHGVYLIPVPNIKIGMKGSRHFVVSKKAPDGKQIFDALQEGIKELRKQGIITKAYRESGFFHPKTIKWKLIFP